MPKDGGANRVGNGGVTARGRDGPRVRRCNGLDVGDVDAAVAVDVGCAADAGQGPVP